MPEQWGIETYIHLHVSLADVLDIWFAVVLDQWTLIVKHKEVTRELWLRVGEYKWFWGHFFYNFPIWMFMFVFFTFPPKLLSWVGSSWLRLKSGQRGDVFVCPIQASLNYCYLTPPSCFSWFLIDYWCRVSLRSAQHPTVYQSWSEKLITVFWAVRAVSTLWDWNRLLARFANSEYTHWTHSAGVAQVADSSDSRFLVLRWEESAAADRGGADRGSRALQTQSCFYSMHWFILTHHGAGRGVRSVAACDGRKTIFFKINKDEANQSFWHDCWLWDSHLFVFIRTSPFLFFSFFF